MKLERTPTGLIEIQLSDDESQFLHFAELVRKVLKGKWTEKINGLDQTYWDLEVQGQIITLHREHYLGVSVFCKDKPEEIAVLERLKEILEATKSD
jgi:hypothetical protein